MNIDENEWLAQEQAMRLGRKAEASPAIDALTASYLPVMQALRAPLEDALPADFASRLAGLVQSRAQQGVVDGRVENLLLWGLGITFGIAALVVSLVYGASWFDAGLLMSGQGGRSLSSWVLTLGACMGGSWFLQSHLQARVARQHTLA